jgi:GlcNAc-PI de-N-acetylase
MFTLKYRLVLLTLFLMIVFSIVFIMYKQSSIYPYKVNKNYTYNFKQSSAQIIDLSLLDQQFKLKKHNNIDQTAFVKINIDTSLIGKFFQPSIKITAGDISLIEFFEHGAKGDRYLNISSLMSLGDVNVTLQGKHVSVKDQTVQLIMFENQSIKKQKILVIAPHPDDAEIAAYGLYSDNTDSTIVTVTAGDAGGYTYDEIYDNKEQNYLKKGQLRTWNSISIPMLAGISPEQTINLGFFDGTLDAMYKDKTNLISGQYINTSDINTFRKQNISSLSKGLSGISNWQSLVKNLVYLLTEIKPDIIITAYPSLIRKIFRS